MRFGLHHQLIARQRHERRAAAGVDRHVGDRLHFVRIELGQPIGQAQAVVQRPPVLSIRTPIQFTPRSRVSDVMSVSSWRALRDVIGPFDAQHHGPPIADQRLILDHGLRPQRQTAAQRLAIVRRAARQRRTRGPARPVKLPSEPAGMIVSGGETIV